MVLLGAVVVQTTRSAVRTTTSTTNRMSSGSCRRAREKSARMEGRVALKRVRGRGRGRG